MAKKILYQDNARRALERGMEIMVEAVSVTLGLIFCIFPNFWHKKGSPLPNSHLYCPELLF